MYIYQNHFNMILTSIGSFFGIMITNLFGGWSELLTGFLILMLIDYISGMAAAICNKSPKTDSGGLSSQVGFTGIVKKFVMILIVIMSVRIDIMIQFANLPIENLISSAVIVALCVNEAISILENASRLGIYVPAIIKKTLAIVQDKEESK